MMTNPDIHETAAWDEEDSQTFIDYGRYFVPERERQMKIINEIISSIKGPHTILELACGQGLLAEILLENDNGRIVIGLDGSVEMRRQAQLRNERFGSRFIVQLFDLAAKSWRVGETTRQGIVSSLAIHHLDDVEKQELFRDIYQMLDQGGVLIIADLIKPAHAAGWLVAGEEWDLAVKERALAQDGNEEGWALFEQERWNMFKHFDSQDIDKPSGLFEQLQWLEEAGFEAVDVYWLKAGHAIYGGWKPTRKTG